MSPVTVAGTATQILAEALAGITYVQLVRPGAPVIFGTFAAAVSMQSGAPTFGTPEPSLIMYVAAALARRLGLPFRSGGGLCGSKIADAQAAYESANTLQTSALAGVNFMLHTAGWLEGGLVMGYEKFIMVAFSRCCPHTGALRKGVLPFRHCRQQQLRAMGGGRVNGRSTTCERNLEINASGLRAAATGSGCRRCAH
jgi:hypothetical protein